MAVDVNQYQLITIFNRLLSIINGQSMRWKFVIIDCYWWHQFGSTDIDFHRLTLILIDIFGQLMAIGKSGVSLTCDYRLPKINPWQSIDWYWLALIETDDQLWSIANAWSFRCSELPMGSINFCGIQYLQTDLRQINSKMTKMLVHQWTHATTNIISLHAIWRKRAFPSSLQ